MVSCTAAKRAFYYRAFKVDLLGGDFMRTVDIPQRVKDYFESGRKKIVKVIPNDNYSLTVHFNNDEIKVYDMSESLFGVFKILEDKEKFKEGIE